jgi:site-specific DNA recombinase
MIAAIYARKSTEQTGVSDEVKSITRQIEHAKLYATNKGWTVSDDHIYVDDGISGAEFAKRPGFLRLMNVLKPKPPFQALIMSEESRLGREAIETAYALKQIICANVRVFFYLEDRERTLDSPTDKVMLSLTAFADELEREKARQRTYDAMRQKAQAGYVTGGRVFGYDNVDIPGLPDATGRPRRSHVELRINSQEADVVRTIFRLYAQGKGLRAIAHQLNMDHAPCPRPRPAIGKPNGWAPSSIREILFRRLYIGLQVWNQTKKRNAWGQKRPHQRPEQEWITLPVPQLRILTEREWQDAHDRLQATRATYLRRTNGQVWGRPPTGIESKYLLTGMGQCAMCGGSLYVRSRHHGKQRAMFYGCRSYHDRGNKVCANSMELPLRDVDRQILATIEADVLQPHIIEAAIQQAMTALRPSAEALTRQRTQLAHELATIETSLARLTAAIESGGDLPTLVASMKEREQAKRSIAHQLTGLSNLARFEPVDSIQLRRTIETRLSDWQGLVGRHVMQARQLLRKLLVGRIRFTFDPISRTCEFVGNGALDQLVVGIVPTQAVVSPTGFEPVLLP